jgi:serine/threonine protein kinase
MMLQPGTQVGRYQIIAALGAGGMGTVYRAHDPRFGRDVAVKVLSADCEQDAALVARFEHEARAAGVLKNLAKAKVIASAFRTSGAHTARR